MNKEVSLHSLPSLACQSLVEADPQALLHREWLVTNGLGGYASGTLSGACTRRYHGLLVAALPAPLGRVLMFNHLAEEVRLSTDRQVSRLAAMDLADVPFAGGAMPLKEFRLEAGLPVWIYEIGAVRIEKRLWLPHLQNAVYVKYRVLAAPAPIRLRLRPSFHFRGHDASVGSTSPPHYDLIAMRRGFEVQSETTPNLRMSLTAERASLVIDGNGGQTFNVTYRIEQARGYESQGTLWSPGYFRVDLNEGSEATLVAATEAWELIEGTTPQTTLAAEWHRRERLLTQAPVEAQREVAADLVLAADQFLIRPATRTTDTALARAAGDEAHTVIAGYHWFTDWGRDTMISLEGLTLATGRHGHAGSLLRTFGRYVRDGLIPNLFPEGKQEGLYHTADASLWYFHALARYLKATDDRETLQDLLPTLNEMVDKHLQGTRFGIRVDSKDGLLTQGAEGYQLTWMDAKVGDWVVTPRRGKAVEINALWYNALCYLEEWNREAGDAARADLLRQHAEQNRASFNKRFWYASGKYLYDIVDGEHGDDAALRPNQLFAISLDHPVLDSSHWSRIVDVATEHLLTPFGLKSLAKGHPDYKATYDGDLRSRDAAYHQGTVWGWLIGPFVDAWLKVHPEDVSKARQFLTGFQAHLSEACVGTISEVFDAEAPFYPRGCAAQAWSVAEVLRCWIATEPAATK